MRRDARNGRFTQFRRALAAMGSIAELGKSLRRSLKT